MEAVDGRAMTALALVCVWLSGGSVRYARGNGEVVRRWRRRLGADRLAELSNRWSTDPDVHLALYRVIEERAEAIERLPGVRALGRFVGDSTVGPVVRKALIADAFVETVLRREARARHADGDAVRLLPLRWRPLLDVGQPVAAQTIPTLWRVGLRVRAAIDRIGLAGRFVAAATWLMLHRGLQHRLPAPREWPVAQVATGDTSGGGRIQDALIYGDGSLHPTRILHIVNEPPSAAFSAHARAAGVTVVYPRALAADFALAWHRLVRGYLARLVPAALMTGPGAPIVEAVLHLGFYALEAELLARHHRWRVCFGWDAYSVRADVRAAVWQRLGRKYVGYIHGFLGSPFYAFHNTTLPVLLSPGRGIIDRLGETVRHVGRTVSIGYMKTERVTDLREAGRRLRAELPTGRVIAAFDSTFAPFWGFNEALYGSFYAALLALVDADPELTVVLKVKYVDEPNPALDAAAWLRSHPRVRVSAKIDAYELLAAADAVVAITTSTVGWEALSCRIPTFFFDPRDWREHNPVARYGRPLLCTNTDELVRAVGDARCGRYLDDAAWQRIVTYEAGFADEKPLTRVRALLLDEAGVATPPAPESAETFPRLVRS